MKFYEFGEKNSPVIILLPGTCCHWKANFGEVVPLLESDFHVVCVSYDGFDETEDSIFPDMLTETEKIEQYIKDNFGGRVRCAYGCSLGGTFVALLVQRGNITVEHGIIGSSDMDKSGEIPARFQAWLVSKVFYGMFQKGRLPKFMAKALESSTGDERRYNEKMIDLFGINGTGMSFVKRESIRNQFYSDLVTPLNKKIFSQGMEIHCFYAEKMGEKYLKRYLDYFKSPDIRRHNLQHEELLICYPLKWFDEVRKCCKMKGN
ncbi:MAG: alpha/beta hydrolase [Prevotella sp.]|nr:alpha/beta hydrolase [Prevotella sp.]